jgi:hypothetical protein
LPVPTIEIPRRFNGPPDSANGGYACAMVAQLIDGPAEVTLRSPPPLDRTMEAAVDRGEVILADGETVIASGKPGAVKLEAPSPVSLEEARLGAASYQWHDGGHPYPTCFVCGPGRPHDDGLHVYPGVVPGTDLIATPWTPAGEFADEDGAVRPEFIWSALDCPSGIVVMLGDEGRSLLGRLTADLRAPVRAGEEHVIVAWPAQRDGRKLLSGSALFTADGELLAAAEATWIVVA